MPAPKRTSQEVFADLQENVRESIKFNKQADADKLEGKRRYHHDFPAYEAAEGPPAHKHSPLKTAIEAQRTAALAASPTEEQKANINAYFDQVNQRAQEFHDNLKSGKTKDKLEDEVANIRIEWPANCGTKPANLDTDINKAVEKHVEDMHVEVNRKLQNEKTWREEALARAELMGLSKEQAFKKAHSKSLEERIEEDQNAPRGQGDLSNTASDLFIRKLMALHDAKETKNKYFEFEGKPKGQLYEVTQDQNGQLLFRPKPPLPDPLFGIGKEAAVKQAYEYSFKLAFTDPNITYLTIQVAEPSKIEKSEDVDRIKMSLEVAQKLELKTLRDKFFEEKIKVMNPPIEGKNNTEKYKNLSPEQKAELNKAWRQNIADGNVKLKSNPDDKINNRMVELKEEQTNSLLKKISNAAGKVFNNIANSVSNRVNPNLNVNVGTEESKIIQSITDLRKQADEPDLRKLNQELMDDDLSDGLIKDDEHKQLINQANNEDKKIQQQQNQNRSEVAKEVPAVMQEVADNFDALTAAHAEFMALADRPALDPAATQEQKDRYAGDEKTVFDKYKAAYENFTTSVYSLNNVPDVHKKDVSDRLKAMHSDLENVSKQLHENSQNANPKISNQEQRNNFQGVSQGLGHVVAGDLLNDKANEINPPAAGLAQPR